MTTRQSFEQWALSNGYSTTKVKRSIEYTHSRTCEAWLAYQAATSRLEAKIKALRESLQWALSNISEEPYEWSCEEDSDAHTAAIALAKATP